MKYIYGLDFGTTNSVIAVLDVAEKKVVKVFKIPSVIYFFDKEEPCLGDDAIDKYLNNNLQGRLLKSVKTLLPQSSFSFTYIYGKKYAAEDLVAILIRKLKRIADDFTGEEVTEVVLGRPVVFSEDPVKDKLAEKRLILAAQKGGFQKIHLQYEPIAAGYLHERSLQAPQYVFIGDFGGGTSDFTLMQLGTGNTNRKKDILKTSGIHVGGDDYDGSLMWHRIVPYFGYGLTYDSYGKNLEIPVHIFRNLCQWEEIAFLKDGALRKKLDVYYGYTNKHPALQRLMTLIDMNLGYALFRKVEEAKVQISETGLGNINYEAQSIHLDESVSEKDFRNYTVKEHAATARFLEDFFIKSPIQEHEIEHIFLTGGTSMLPQINELFQQRFGADKINRGDNFNSVAEGLALSYLYLNE